MRLQESGEHIRTVLTRCTCMQVPVPQHRMTPLKDVWLKLYQPITEVLHLDMRMNLKAKKVRHVMLARSAAWPPIGLPFATAYVCAFHNPVSGTVQFVCHDWIGQPTFQSSDARQVEIKSTPATLDIACLQRAADFVQAFLLGASWHEVRFQVEPPMAILVSAQALKLLMPLPCLDLTTSLSNASRSKMSR